MSRETIGACLGRWLAAHSIGRKPRTVHFNREIVQTLERNWPHRDRLATAVSADETLALAQQLTHYSPSRWNAMVSAIRTVTPDGRLLRRRPLRLRQFTPPTQLQFAAFLAQCDAAPRTQAGLIVRFLSFSGLRIGEARALTWSNVLPDRIEVPGAIAKSGVLRSVPIVPGMAEVLDRLRRLSEGVGLVLPRGDPRKAIRTACRRAGLPPLSPHCFRHLFATRCIESGVDMPTVARWLGHKDGGALLARTYFHLLDEHSREMASRVRIAA